ncbi:MAG: carboxypeptidase regulatory-like domain-containing protein [Pyrinomonadaceae bacterium]
MAKSVWSISSIKILRDGGNNAPLMRMLSLCLLFMLVVAVPHSLGQTTGSATLRGTVKDPNGAAVPNASLTLINSQTNAERRVSTGDEGSYTFTSLEPGIYTLRVEGQSFKTYVQNDLTLSPSDTRGQDVTLELGGASETVVVTSDNIQQIQTETGEKSNVITARQIENLSLVGRNSLELLRILPGVVAPDAETLEVNSFTTGANATAAYSVNGQRGTSNNVSIDGSRVLDTSTNNGTIITLNNDMVQEVKVQTSNYAPEFGSSAVQITALTKTAATIFTAPFTTTLGPTNCKPTSVKGLSSGTKRMEPRSARDRKANSITRAAI